MTPALLPFLIIAFYVFLMFLIVVLVNLVLLSKKGRRAPGYRLLIISVSGGLLYYLYILLLTDTYRHLISFADFLWGYAITGFSYLILSLAWKGLMKIYKYISQIFKGPSE